jgi:signal transduction histidine kinase
VTRQQDGHRRAVEPLGLESRARAFILLRFTLIIATAYLILVQLSPARISIALGAVFTLALLSNIVLLFRAREFVDAPWFAGLIVVADTLWITFALLLSGTFSAEFFYLYFFVLFIAGIGENLRLIALGVIVVSSAYFFVVGRIHGVEEILTTQSLIRIPFLFAVAIFYGYLVDRLRSEQRQVREEAAVIRELEENRRYMKEVNRSLEAEVAERRRAEEQLRELSELKSSFVSMVAHELRNPLTAMKYAIDILGRGASGTPEERFVEIVQRNVGRSTAIIDDLRDLSKIEAGKLGFNFEAVHLAPILDAAVATFEGQAAESKVVVTSEIPSGIPQAFADPKRMEQVIVNLVSNAIKVTPANGSVTVRARVDEGRIEVSVADTGPGLSAEDQRRIFEPFFRTDDSRQRKIAGTGLGLSICRDLVRAHGSELGLVSAPHKGARFFFRLWPDGGRAREVVALEERVRELKMVRKFAFLVVVAPEIADDRVAVVEQIGEAVQRRLVRADDVAVTQAAWGRIAVFLPSTRIDGGWAVRRSLEDAVAPYSATVHGPVMYPDRGLTATALVDAALSETGSAG